MPNGTGVVLPEPVDRPSDVTTTDRAYVPTVHLFRMLWGTMAEIEVSPEVQAVAVKHVSTVELAHSVQKEVLVDAKRTLELSVLDPRAHDP